MFRAHGARNIKRHEINLLQNKFCASSWLITKINTYSVLVSCVSMNIQMNCDNFARCSLGPDTSNTPVQTSDDNKEAV